MVYEGKVLNIGQNEKNRYIGYDFVMSEYQSLQK